MLEIITGRPNRIIEHELDTYDAITISNEENGNYYYRNIGGDFIMEITNEQDINLYKINDNITTWEDFIKEEIELYDGDYVEYYFNHGSIQIRMEN